MKGMLPYLNLIIAYPPTWIALGVVIVGELGIAVWFQPPALILAVAILIGIILLALWPMVLELSRVPRRGVLPAGCSQ